MLSFEEKLAIAGSFPELQRKDVSLGRVNYHYEDSSYEKKTVVYHLHPNGNGFVYAGHLDDCPFDIDDKGFVNIREFAAEDYRALIAASIRSLTDEFADTEPSREERWTNGKKQTLDLKFDDEDEMWYIYSGLNLDAVFDTYEEAKGYLVDEGFSRT